MDWGKAGPLQVQFKKNENWLSNKKQDGDTRSTPVSATKLVKMGGRPETDKKS